MRKVGLRGHSQAKPSKVEETKAKGGEIEHKLKDLREAMSSRQSNKTNDSQMNGSSSRWRTNTNTTVTKPPSATLREKSKDPLKDTKGFNQSYKQNALTKMVSGQNLQEPEAAPTKGTTATKVTENLEKAKTIKKMSYIESVLKDLKLDKFVPVFTPLGIIGPEDLIKITKTDLENLKMPPGHQLKLLNFIDELKASGDFPISKGKFQDGSPQKGKIEAPPQKKDSEIQKEDREEEKMGDKTCCWQCYRQYFVSQGYKPESCDRVFCSERCWNFYLEYHQKSCPKCGTAFLKESGSYGNGKWYCSQKCAPAIEELIISMKKAGI